MPAPCLFIAPQGLTVTGVTTWIALAARGLARMGRPVGVLVHGGIGGHDEVGLGLPEGVPLIRRDDLARIDELGGDLSGIVPAYREAAERVRGLPGAEGPVVLFPARHGDCFAAACGLTIADPAGVRVVGLQQIDGAYESAIIARYEPALAVIAGVSTRVAGLLRERFPERAGDVAMLPNAAVVPGEAPNREPLDGRPLRLLYTGRIEHEQKRVGALLALSAELDRRGVAHDLTLLGDGPASGEVDGACVGLPHCHRLPAVAPAEVAGHLARADILVMASRTEGLSLSLLEAMAHACCPVITKTPSGASDAIDDGVQGVLVPFDAGDDDEAVARALADGVERARGLGLAGLGLAARERVRERFSDLHLARGLCDLVDRAARSEPRAWPADRALAFSARGVGQAGGEGSGSVPAGGAERLGRVLASLAGKALVIHGVGQHTRQLAGVLADSPATIVGFTDDDPRSHGTMLFGWPVVAPPEVHTLGATDVVISSAMHEDAIYGRRGVYEGQGIRVHRVYQAELRS